MATRAKSMHSAGSMRGFTLVELAVVIVIIAVLTTVGAILYRGYTERASDIAVQKMLEDIDAQITVGTTRDPDGYCPTNADILTAIDQDSTAIDKKINNILLLKGTFGELRCNYGIVIYSVSGKAFYITSGHNSIQEYTGPAHGVHQSCSASPSSTSPWSGMICYLSGHFGQTPSGIATSWTFSILH